VTEIATGPELTLTRCDVRQMSGVRAWLRRTVEEPDRVGDAELVATELITNAIEHGRGAHAVRVTVDPSGTVRVEVDDDDPAGLLTVGRSRLGEFRGNGLAVVDALATWGVTRRDDGKTVWASL
jgi:hypothetical protein